MVDVADVDKVLPDPVTSFDAVNVGEVVELCERDLVNVGESLKVGLRVSEELRSCAVKDSLRVSVMVSLSVTVNVACGLSVSDLVSVCSCVLVADEVPGERVTVTDCE